MVYMKSAEELRPPGFTVPFNWALYAVTFVAASATGVGAAVGDGSVVKVPIGEVVTPEELVPSTLTSY
ncbi:unannotated protein [freshwater metagenome]|uniref:Unannotated protein n=1 Tax=freshwater metagenome TaxID=449393 RepID=A0A6J6UY49_9ZZZZ